MYCCASCSKEFTNKTSLTNHKSLCDILSLSTREKTVKSEELESMPCHEELVRITQALALKYTTLQKSIEKIEKATMNYTKCKINGEQWLAQNIRSEYTYEQLLNKIHVDNDDISMLFEKKTTEIFMTIIDRHIRKVESPIAMINGKIYVCKSSGDEGGRVWMLMERKEIVAILNTILQRIMEVITKWRCENSDRIANNDTLSIEYNKVLIKLMNTNFNKDSIYGKMRTHIGNNVLFEVVNTIEYIVI